jgi:D-arginine dehydrogenase
MPARTADIIVIGAGIAGASAAAHLAASRRIVVLERESQPGYHSTGRSAALFTETYGNLPIRLLSRASRPFYEACADGAVDYPILSPRGLLVYAPPDQIGVLDQAWAELKPGGTSIARLDTAETRAIVPVLRPECVAASIYEPGAVDIDVHALQGPICGGSGNTAARSSRTRRLLAFPAAAGSGALPRPRTSFWRH